MIFAQTIATLLVHFGAAAVPALPPSNPFARFEILARTFPEAFRPYVNRQYLIPMAEAEWGEGEHGIHEVTIVPRLTAKGLRKESANMVPTISMLLTTNGGEFTFSLNEFSSWIPPEYGWRVLIAELLLKYPYVDSIGHGTIASLTGPELGPCAERLARGIDLLEVAKDLPLARAARDFGFEVASAEIGDVDDPTSRAITPANCT